MKDETNKSGTELMKDALDKLLANPRAKINMNTVATLAGLNHSLFRKASYQEIKLEILAAQKVRDAEISGRSKEEQINTLETRLKNATSKLERLAKEQQKPSPKIVKETEGALMARLVEMYRYNDLLRAELAEKYREKIDEETGEVLSFDFERRR